MYAEELLVHDCRQRQCAERLHTSVVYLFRIFVLALEFEGEVIGQMSTLVVTSQKPQCVGIPYLERPQVQHTLMKSEKVTSSHCTVQITNLNAEISTVHVITKK